LRSDSRKRSRPTDKFGGKPGLFKEGDWRCEKCNNVNFSWRSACNMCKELKSTGNDRLSIDKNRGEHDRPRDRSRDRDNKYYEHHRNKGKYSNSSYHHSDSRKSKKHSSRSKSRSISRRYMKNSRSISESSLFSSKSNSQGNKRHKSSRNRKKSKSRSSPSLSPYRQNDLNNNNHPLRGMCTTLNPISENLVPNIAAKYAPIPLAQSGICASLNTQLLKATAIVTGPRHSEMGANPFNVFDLSLSMLKDHYKTGDKSDSDSVHKMRFIKDDN